MVVNDTIWWAIVYGVVIITIMATIGTVWNCVLAIQCRKAAERGEWL